MKPQTKSLTSKIIHRLSQGAYGRYRLKRAVRQTPCRIVIGASGCRQVGWTATECEVLNPLDPGQWASYFRLGSVDAMVAEHVWEHFNWEDGAEAARNCFDFLKPGGYLRVAVPDGNHPNRDYIEWVKPNGVGPGSENHQILFNYRNLQHLFETVGFIVDRLEYFDEHGNFYYRDWRLEDGLISRSRRFDRRNAGGRLAYTSIIIDAIKPIVLRSAVVNAA